MIIKEVKLKNFRNYNNETIMFDPHKNIIIGNNAQGKTNIIESLVLLSTTRSHRHVSDESMIKMEEDFGSTEVIYDDGKIKRIKVILSNKGKTLIYNNNVLNKTSEFIGLLNVIVFDPSQISFFDDSPKERRKVIDMEISKISKKYVNAMNQYQKLLKDRNVILKQDKIDINYLEVLEKQMVVFEDYIIQERKRFCMLLNERLNHIFNKISLSEEYKLSVEYMCCIKEDNHLDALKDMYLKNRDKDMYFHMTTNGIHREDFIFKMNDKRIEEIASQGQKRLTLLAFKLFLIDYIKEFGKVEPVLLLDDVLSELDDNKQYALLSYIPSHIQTIITTTSINDSIKRFNYKIIEIENGKVKGG